MDRSGPAAYHNEPWSFHAQVLALDWHPKKSKFAGVRSGRDMNLSCGGAARGEPLAAAGNRISPPHLLHVPSWSKPWYSKVVFA